MSSYPQVAVGAVVRRGTAVLLIQRGTEPNAGQWTIPGGKVHAGETLQQAAEREIREETGIHIRAGEPVFSFDVIDRDNKGELRYHYVIVDLLAEYLDGEPQADDDALDAAWIEPETLARLDVNATTRQLLARLEDVPASQESDDQKANQRNRYPERNQ
ncbi:MAG: NUDIX hydrolase [Thiohalophilus sp.]|uniref:NUDIX hydrolase n=1 Tax=Thiohalophilus sp. TaxID=3028392 RepID=UPI0028708C4D|nr:NUDIX hydrolase [Thiohalophilus sp.]MDR9435816.1 NUDIX hydrolase [Thiohalophilus sp.]